MSTTSLAERATHHAFGVVTIDDFLPSAVHARVAEEVDQQARWEPDCWVLRPEGDVERVEPGTTPPSLGRDGAAAPVWNRNLRLPPTELGRLPALAALVRLLAHESFKHIVMTLLGCELSARNPSVEVARYEQGHFLSPHRDTFDGRRAGVVYIVNSHRPSGGALCLFRLASPDTVPRGLHVSLADLAGEERVEIAPVPNRVVVFPIDEPFLHAVTPLDAGDRSAVSLHYFAAARS